MSRRIAVQQDRIFLRSMCLYCHLDSLIQIFHGTDIYLLSKMGFRGLKLLWMSVLCKAGDLGKLRQICNSGYSRVNMFLKTLLKAYVHIKDIKRQCIGLFFSKKLFNHMNMCQIIFLFGKKQRSKIFLILWICTIFLVYYVYVGDESSPLISGMIKRWNLDSLKKWRRLMTLM